MQNVIANSRSKKKILARIGEAVKEARGDRTATHVKNVTGMTSAQISEVEGGKRNLTLINALALRAATGLDLNALADALSTELIRD